MSTCPPSILVVDDDPDIRQNLADILMDLGYAVDTAPDAPSALDLLRQRAYDIALLDYKLPGMNGLELYREIRNLRAGTVAIIISAFTNQATEDEASSAGAWQVLSKPVDLPRLLGLLGKALEQPRVMVVDDDPDLCRTLWDLLRERDYRVCVVHDAKTASQLARERNYDVVLIDMRLENGTGAEVYRMIHDANPEARTVVISAHRQEFSNLIDQVVREGADAVCYKPFDMPVFLATIDRLTRMHRKE